MYDDNPKLKAEAQDIFDTVVNHLWEQGGPASDGSRCLYRGPNGTKCAFGVLIPDEDYSPDMEHRRVGSLIDDDHYRVLARYRHHRALINLLQYAHDTDDFRAIGEDGRETFNWDKLRTFFYCVTDSFQLDYNVISLIKPEEKITP